jgi:hypothetical protein
LSAGFARAKKLTVIKQKIKTIDNKTYDALEIEMVFTWGDLRTLNAGKLTEEMMKLGKGVRIHFRLNTNVESQEWVIIPREDYDQILFDHAENNRLKSKLKTITTITEL